MVVEKNLKFRLTDDPDRTSTSPTGLLGLGNRKSAFALTNISPSSTYTSTGFRRCAQVTTTQKLEFLGHIVHYELWV